MKFEYTVEETNEYDVGLKTWNETSFDSRCKSLRISLIFQRKFYSISLPTINRDDWFRLNEQNNHIENSYKMVHIT